MGQDGFIPMIHFISLMQKIAMFHISHNILKVALKPPNKCLMKINLVQGSHDYKINTTKSSLMSFAIIVKQQLEGG